MSLTKADIADRLFEEVGLNKREAKEFVNAYFEAIKVPRLKVERTSSFQGLVIFSCVIKIQGRAEIPRRGKKFRLPHAV